MSRKSKMDNASKLINIISNLRPPIINDGITIRAATKSHEESRRKSSKPFCKFIFK